MSEFDPADLRRECFGGKHESAEATANQHNKMQEEWSDLIDNSISKNAYILFYDKVDKVPTTTTERVSRLAQNLP